VAEKGLTYLLEAAKIVTADFPDAKFLLTGYGEERSRLLQLRHQLSLEDNVILTSPKSQEEIVTLLNKCTLFALPSLSEGFPAAVLEAMSCGRPVVVTAGIGLEEVVGDAGLYAQAGNPHELANAITTILAHENYGTSLGRRGRERVTQYYDWGNVVSAVNDLYRKAIEEK
jgi:glycosyltransferase involved in cell wall biosynthesis